MTITKNDLEAKVKRVNTFLNKIQLKVSYRYNYTAIDIYKKASGSGVLFDTLEAGLTKPEAYKILNAIETVLMLETEA